MNTSSRSRKYSHESPLFSKYLRDIFTDLGMCLATRVCSKTSILSNNSLAIRLSAIFINSLLCHGFPAKNRGLIITQWLWGMSVQSESQGWLVGNKQAFYDLRLLLVMIFLSDSCLLVVMYRLVCTGLGLFGCFCAQYVLSDITHRRLSVASSSRLMLSVATYTCFILLLCFV